MTEPRTKPLRGALIGYGFIGSKGHVAGYRSATLRDRVRIEAIADSCEERRIAAKNEFPHARMYADAQSLLEAESHRLDFVDIATPPHVHAEIARSAMARGLHVLCEKPLATTLADAKAMLEDAVRFGRVLYPCHNYKYAPVIRAAREELARGRIGPVHLVTLATFRTTHARGVSEWRPDWRREHQYSGGGIAMDHGSHTFYLAFDWLGQYPTAVSAKMSTIGSFDTEDNFSCALTFPSATVTAHLSWTAGVREVMYTIHGEHGAITIDDDVIKVTLRDSNGAVRVETNQISSDWLDASHAGWFAAMFQRFEQAIAEHDYVSSDAQDALRCIQLITSAYESAQRGCLEVNLEDPWLTTAVKQAPRIDSNPRTSSALMHAE
ncbi:MAG: Gfo/Idh/MocA family oxidoreductase [Polyangiaceae bacterium]